MCPRDFSRSIESAISRLRRFSIRMAVCSSLKRVGFWPRAKRYQAMGTGQVPPKSTGHRTATPHVAFGDTFGVTVCLLRASAPLRTHLSEVCKRKPLAISHTISHICGLLYSSALRSANCIQLYLARNGLNPIMKARQPTYLSLLGKRTPRGKWFTL